MWQNRISAYLVTFTREILNGKLPFFCSVISRTAALKSGIPVTSINCIIVLDFLMFYQIFFSPQVERCAIIANKYGIYELPHELQNDFRFRSLRN